MAIDARILIPRLIGTGLLTVAGYYALWGGEYSAFDLGRLADQQAQETARLAEARIQVDSLNLLIQRLESDPATIEAVARERFGMIREGETLYRFVPTEPAKDEEIALRP